MMYPLVLDLAAAGVPVAVACRVLGFTKQGFYKWCAKGLLLRRPDSSMTEIGWLRQARDC